MMSELANPSNVPSVLSALSSVAAAGINSLLSSIAPLSNVGLTYGNLPAQQPAYNQLLVNYNKILAFEALYWNSNSR